MLLVAHRTPPSRAACARLAAAGAGVFEVDTQADAAGRLVVSHYAPLRRYPLVQRDNWRLRWHTLAVRDPLLADVADAVPPDRLVLLDLKAKQPAERARLVAAIRAGLPEPDRYRVCGPRPDDLDELRSTGLRTWRTIGTPAELAAVLAGAALPDDAVTVRHSLLDAGVLARLRERVPAVYCWTVNEVSRARTLRALGVDGVTTDRLAVLRALAAG